MSIPSKWCIKTTPENKDVINKWFNDGCGSENYYSNSGNYMHYPRIGAPDSSKPFMAGDHNVSEKYSRWEEISYDQFLQFTNKQGIVDNYQIY